MPALAAYALVRSIGVAFVASRIREGGPSLGQLLAAKFDTQYYVHIADYGYAAPMTGLCQVQGELCKYAFFPLYPSLIRGVSTIVPLPTGYIAWGIAVFFAVLAAWGIFAIAELLVGRKAAVVTVVLWGIAPHAMVQSMAYTEPVFTAIAAWALYAVLTQRWGAAAALAVLAGLTRPSGAAVVAAVVISAMWALAKAIRKPRATAPGRSGILPLVACIVIAPLGWFAWFVWVGYRAGRWDGYFVVQEKWGSTFDGGSFTLHRMVELFSKLPITLNTVVASGAVTVAVVLFIICLQQRQPAVLLIYAAVLLLIAIGGAGYFHSKARFILPAFPLLLPLARVIAATRPTVTYTVLASATLVSSAYGSYLMLVWPQSP
ncbi:glycosyltransferase family 39 protein [Streptomyces sp. NPDC000880]